MAGVASSPLARRGVAMSDSAAEPVLTVESREELVFLLGQACELEHGLMSDLTSGKII
jgi:hypothetical protein